MGLVVWRGWRGVSGGLFEVEVGGVGRGMVQVVECLCHTIPSQVVKPREGTVPGRRRVTPWAVLGFCSTSGGDATNRKHGVL
jgi:hypothetical protein